MTSVIFAPCEAEKKYWNVPDIVFHYTSPDSLVEIINAKQLWFSRFDCLNDTGEGKYIQEIYARVLDKLRSENQIDGDFLNKVEGVKPSYCRFFRQPGKQGTKSDDGVTVYEGFDVTTKPYICCFSKEDDSLPMWNYYSKNGSYEGYNIGFHYRETV